MKGQTIMYDFFRVASAVPAITVGDTAHNAGIICEQIRNASVKNADLIVFPELALTGYTCGDLFFQSVLQEGVKSGLSVILDRCRDVDAAVVVGAPLELGGRLYNCAVVMVRGKIVGIVPKTFLPNYNEYSERRWFASSEDLTVAELSASALGLDESYPIPVGRDLIFRFGGTVCFGVEICEDGWTPITPGSFLALNGAELIVNLSASNETVSKRSYRRDLICQQSARNLCEYMCTSAGTTESTTDLVFSGHTVIAENGTVLKENDTFMDTDYVLVCDVDIGRIKADRHRFNTFHDTARLYGSYEPCREVGIADVSVKGDGSLYENIRKQPFVPSSEQERLQRCREIFEMQVCGLKQRVRITGSKLVLGVSGGLDSTLALLVCAETMRQLGRPVGDVVGITMPCFGTSDRTYNNSLELMRTLGVSSEEINIREACLQHFRDIGHAPSVLDATYENSQARERTQVLMDYASRVGGFVVGTGDLSELALGWCTYNGDHMSMYGVNAGIPKTLIRWVIDSLMQSELFVESRSVLQDILDTPISPELLPPDASGNIAQQTESIVGPYLLHDFFLYYMLRFGFEPAKIYEMAKRVFAEDFDKAVILQWLKTFYKRFFSQQFKRNCMPDGVKVGSVALSPRGGWNMPSDASAAVWMAQIETLN